MMVPEATLAGSRAAAADLARTVSIYARPERLKAIWQIINTLVPYLALWALMAVMVQQGYSYWAVLGVSVLAAAFHVRVFIIFHDCCHGSFFTSRRANRILGYITGILTFTPFEQWRRSHAMHHDTVGDLDRRGVGDIWVLTAEEYEAALPWKRLAYRIVRNPVFVLTVGTLIIFIIGHRYFHKVDRKQERRSVLITNVALAVLILIASLIIGIGTYLLVQVPIVLIAGAAGLWLFYVQHQFEGTYWARHEEWDPIKAALQGSSFYKLPKILQWFTGNIGFHHIHHVQQRIPNYNLERCYKDVPAMQSVKPMTFLDSLKCARLHVWDEVDKRLRGYTP